MAAREYPNEPESLLRTFATLTSVFIASLLAALATAYIFLTVFQLGSALSELVPESHYGEAWFGVVMALSAGTLPLVLKSLWGEQKSKAEQEEVMEKAVTIGQLRLFVFVFLYGLIDLSILFLVGLVAGAVFGPIAAFVAPLAERALAIRLGVSISLAVQYVLFSVVRAIGIARGVEFDQVVFWRGRSGMRRQL